MRYFSHMFDQVSESFDRLSSHPRLVSPRFLWSSLLPPICLIREQHMTKNQYWADYQSIYETKFWQLIINTRLKGFLYLNISIIRLLSCISFRRWILFCQICYNLQTVTTSMLTWSPNLVTTSMLTLPRTCHNLTRTRFLGKTALMWASYHGHSASMELLLFYGAGNILILIFNIKFKI